MSGDKGVALSNVIHRVSLEITEDGGGFHRGARVSWPAAQGWVQCRPHPFIYIRHNKTQTSLLVFCSPLSGGARCPPSLCRLCIQRTIFLNKYIVNTAGSGSHSHTPVDLFLILFWVFYFPSHSLRRHGALRNHLRRKNCSPLFVRQSRVIGRNTVFLKENSSREDLKNFYYQSLAFPLWDAECTKRQSSFPGTWALQSFPGMNETSGGSTSTAPYAEHKGPIFPSKSDFGGIFRKIICCIYCMLWSSTDRNWNITL